MASWRPGPASAETGADKAGNPDRRHLARARLSRGAACFRPYNASTGPAALLRSRQVELLGRAIDAQPHAGRWLRLVNITEHFQRNAIPIEDRSLTAMRHMPGKPGSSAYFCQSNGPGTNGQTNSVAVACDPLKGSTCTLKWSDSSKADGPCGLRRSALGLDAVLLRQQTTGHKHQMPAWVTTNPACRSFQGRRISMAHSTLTASSPLRAANQPLP